MLIDLDNPTPAKPTTLHERWSDRINWRLADIVDGVHHGLSGFGRWLTEGEWGWAAKRLSDKLRGYED